MRVSNTEARRMTMLGNPLHVRLLAQDLLDAREALQQIAEEPRPESRDGTYVCPRCGAERGHAEDCPVTIARRALGMEE